MEQNGTKSKNVPWHSVTSRQKADGPNNFEKPLIVNQVHSLHFVMCSGGALGGAVATYATWGKFKSVGQVIMDMDKGQKQILYDTAMVILKKASIDDIVTLNAMMAGDLVLKKQLLDTVVHHVKNQLHMELNE